jgi:hypothetical protein
MSDIMTIIEGIKEKWAVPKYALSKEGQLGEFLLCCSFFPATPSEVVSDSQLIIPNDLQKFWVSFDHAELFRDITYGQWGLDILSREVALCCTKEQIECRPCDFLITDLIIGQFRGDSDMLMINCNSQVNNYGQITVVTPLDKRHDWVVVANNFTDFLKLYAQYNGDKFWE